MADTSCSKSWDLIGGAHVTAAQRSHEHSINLDHCSPVCALSVFALPAALSYLMKHLSLISSTRVYAFKNAVIIISDRLVRSSVLFFFLKYWKFCACTGRSIVTRRTLEQLLKKVLVLKVRTGMKRRSCDQTAGLQMCSTYKGAAGVFK